MSTTRDTATRPASIDLRDVDPCALVDGLDKPALGLDERAAITQKLPLLPDSKACFVSGAETNTSLAVGVVRGAGVGEFVQLTPGESDPLTAAGYPGVEVVPSGIGSVCLGAVDVADGQFVYLKVAAANPVVTPLPSVDELCRTLPRAADAVITALARG